MERKNGLKNLISGDDALQAIEIVGKMAVENNIDWAVCGGIAMAIYGSPRLTKDVDIIASKRLPLEKEKIMGNSNREANTFLSKPKGAKFRLTGFCEMMILKRFTAPRLRML